ncbi:molybdopterin-dependent oxidoreductase [Rhodobacteraceae bacterium nBUS_24]
MVSPIADDIPPGIDAEYIAPRPGSDTAIMLGLCHEMIQRGRADEEFLSTYCIGLEPFRDYLFGQADGSPKSLAWAAEVSDVPLTSLEGLADQISEGRVMLTASWSLQRAHRGEQSFWTLIALAAILGQIGLPGGGFTFGYGSLNAVGEGAHKGLVPTLPTLGNPKGMTIPVARFADMLQSPGSQVHFDGKTIVYPDIKIIYWAGGNPFHHSQDLFRLNRLWTRPETVIVHEQTWTATAKRADIVLPATTSLERNDIGGTSRDPHVFFMPKVIEPVGMARNDYDIFSDLSKRLGCRAAFTEGRTEAEWLEHLWKQTQNRAQKLGLKVPDFGQLKKQNIWHVPKPTQPEILLENFVSNPEAYPLPTPSGKIEITSTTIASYAYDDMSAFPEWRTPKEWLGDADETKVALLSRQPEKFLHSQLNQTYLANSYRPTVLLNKVEAAKRGLKNSQHVILRSDNGSCVAQLKISNSCRDGVAVMETGHHFVGGDDNLDLGGNANALTYDFPTSTLSQATAAQSCLITISRIATL